MKSLSSAIPEGFERIESGVDWLTWVQKDGDRDGSLCQLADKLIAREAAKGAKVKEFTMQGYRGRACAGVAYGSRPDSDLLRISGQVASGAPTLMRSFAGHPTRLDVQTSFRLKRSRTTFGPRFLLPLEGSQSSRRGRPLKWTKWKGSDGAYSGMVGARTSPKYIRVYDKGRELGTDPPGLYWRVEVEAKQEIARQLWQSLQMASDGSRWCLGCCETMCRSSGLWWPPGVSGDTVSVPRADGAAPPEVERTLRWFEQLVRPSVVRLVEALGPARVVRALGLDAYVKVDPFFEA